MVNGYFVTATGTDVGKTFVTALLVKKWRDSGIDAGYYKAALSGAEFKNGKWIAGDAEYVKNFAGLSDTQEEMVSYVYKEAVSPHLAARKEGNPVELSKVVDDFGKALKKHSFVFVEGSGGILCPIRYDVDRSCNLVGQQIFLEDIMKAVNLPLLIVTSSALGSINACVLTVEYARSRGLSVRGIVVNRYGDSGNLEMENDNICMMQKITGLEILAKVKTGDFDLGAGPF
ncbi:MAG: dethiobiotin synthase [Fibrobacter sp.]|nr:dethiobiotin synthase [Fibrobacter sp.]